MSPYDDEDTVDELPPPPRREMLASDRELLELAARALGARFEEVDGEGYGNLHFPDGSVIYGWNSLLFSGDTFELQVRLRISVDPGDDAVCAIAGDGAHVLIEMGIGSDLVPAGRRAVTRAAAEIGKVK